MTTIPAAHPTLPELRHPPHDPLTLRLGGRLGWPVAVPSGSPVGSLPGTTDGALVLPAHPDAERCLTESSGSFGGLRPPSWVGVDHRGAGADVWLLDRRRSRLRRFDPCECRFDDVPCLAGPGSGPGQLLRPGGITVAAGRLFVCDAGNQRVQVVLLPNLVVSGLWRAPMEWEPTGVAVDAGFRVHVVDPLNGCVHRFGWSGRYLGRTGGTGAARHVAVGSDGAVYVAGELEVHRIAPGRIAVTVPAGAEELAAVLGPAPFPVARDGSVSLGGSCEPVREQWFDPQGEAGPPPPASGQLHLLAAAAVVGPLDSQLDDCVWHRLTVLGAVPAGAGFTVSTHTAQVALSADEVDALADAAWETRATCTELDAGSEWDTLLRSPPGRHLWLRIELFGGGRATPRIDELVLEFPRISLRRFLPAVYGAEAGSADFTDRLLGLFDRSLRDLETRLDELPAVFDPRATPALDWLASWVGVEVDHRLPEATSRELLASSGPLMDLQGTATGLRRLLLLVLGFDRAGACAAGPADEGSCGTGRHPCRCGTVRQACPPRAEEPSRWVPPPLVLEHFRLRRWFEAGAATLGDRAVLWGESIVNRSQLGGSAQVGVTALRGTQDPARDRFHVHAHRFSVFVPASAGATPARRLALERLVGWASPAHTLGQVEYVDARMRIGVQSTIGLDTAVARQPAGVALGSTRLGPASVLDGADRQTIDTSAVGTTAVLG